MIATETGVTTVVSELITDPWTVHAGSAGTVGTTTTWLSAAPEVHG
jgi:hypothetical protein